ncbi:MAG: DNA replication/repair protein RecF [Gammaproteobacteria bacterium]|nr:DNA replication/repair protein RecF [Gammaproteobacteria bacterium]
MALRKIKIHRVRNLKEVSLDGLGRVNVFYGRNGSGKTSVLESIHLLGMARSFRGNSIRTLISHGGSQCTVFGELFNPQPGGTVPIGVHREASGEMQIRIGGSPARGVAQLVEQLPLQVITTDSFDLLTGAPSGRRQFLDWGVFHVEHRFYTQWQRFQRCIKQRNKLLRRGKISDQELDVWTRDLAASGAAIGEYREAYFQLLTPRFKHIMERLAPSLEGLDLRYRQGWDRSLDYAKALEQGISADLEQGYTHIGPQRADIRVTSAGHLAAETLSRGQQKLVVCGLKLAQGQLMSEHGKGKCTYLIDDLPSELDREHSELVCSLLDSMQAQVFITCVDRRDITGVWPKGSNLALFHVEHGTLERTNPGD